MKKYIVCLCSLIVFLNVKLGYGGGSILFNEVDEYFTIADSADLSFQDGDWSLGMFLKIDDNSGNFFQYFFSNGPIGTANSINCFTREVGAATNPGEICCQVNDSDTTQISNADFRSKNRFAGDGLWRLFIIQRETGSSQFAMYTVHTSSSVELEDTELDGGFDDIDSDIWYMGRKDDGNADRYYGGNMAYVFRAQKSFSTDEIKEIWKNPTSHIDDMDLFIPLLKGGINDIDLGVNKHTITQNNSPGNSMEAPDVFVLGGI